MSALAQHIVLRLRDSRVIARSRAERRKLARIILDRCRGWALLAFRAADTHIHLLVACNRPAGAELARRIEISLKRQLGHEIGFAPAYLEPIRDQRHLSNAFYYVLRQEQRHGLNSDPFHDGSNLVDLLGLRSCGLYTAKHVRALLPRVRRADLLELVGVGSLDQPVELTLHGLAAATAAAAALPDLAERSPHATEARRAAVALAGRAFSGRRLAPALHTSERTVKRLRRQKPCDELVRAIRLQHRLRATAAPQAMIPVTRPAPPPSDSVR